MKIITIYINKYTLVRILISLQHCTKEWCKFSPECGPDNLQKSIKISFNCQSWVIQWTVIPRNGIQLGEVHASSVNERRPGAF